jgi:two-component system, NtrC family, sensor histidine kinase KinB
MLGLRQKLSLAFGGILVITVIIGVQSVRLLTELGGSIDVILLENYRSVIACQDMKEALERIDSGVLFTLLGYRREGTELIRRNEAVFATALEAELNNVTLPGEGEKAARLQDLFEQYRQALEEVTDPTVVDHVKTETYFSKLLPLFQKIKAAAGDILKMNQQNMMDANDRARQIAAAARKRMLTLLFAGGVMAAGFVWFTGRWILRPIARLTASAHEIKSGNLDLVVQTDSKDEIGALSEAFNAMAASLRELRRTDRARLARIQRATEQAFRVLPDAVAIADLEGTVEVASTAALESFDLRPNQQITTRTYPYVADLFHQAVQTGRVADPTNGQALIQRFVQGKERYFRPKAVPILDKERYPVGVMIILSDVTQERQQDELKQGVISTVAHQLRTPLTSVRMALHLLLQENVGPLTGKQEELLVAAREETERLHGVLEQLLNISRIESGKASMDRKAVSAHQLVFECVEPFRRSAQDKGIALEVHVPDDAPEVVADPVLITQVFANLLSNSLKYTDPGGVVSVAAKVGDEAVEFSVSDTGRGIPNEYLQKILEQFFRVPGQETDSGAGLGLSIVQEIVAAHGGAVNVKSTVGMGSTFSFSLKRAYAE